MKHTSQVEIERKYDVDENALVPTFTSVDGIESVSVDDAVQLEAIARFAWTARGTRC